VLKVRANGPTTSSDKTLARTHTARKSQEKKEVTIEPFRDWRCSERKILLDKEGASSLETGQG